jgi:hypothetical protein
MALYAKQPESKSEPIPPGTYQAICYGVVDIGTQHSEMYDTDQRKIVILWELPDLRVEFEKDSKKYDLPRAVSKQYTLSLGEKANLYKDLLSWRGVPFTPEELDKFDVFNVLGVNCQLTIVNEPSKDGKRIKSKITSVTKLMKGLLKKEPERAKVTYSIEENGIDTLPPELPDWLKKEIMKSTEYQAIMNARSSGKFDPTDDEPPATDPIDDTIPF